MLARDNSRMLPLRRVTWWLLHEVRDDPVGADLAELQVLFGARVLAQYVGVASVN